MGLDQKECYRFKNNVIYGQQGGRGRSHRKVRREADGEMGGMGKVQEGLKPEGKGEAKSRWFGNWVHGF